MHRSRQFQPLANDCYQYVDAHRGPDLSFHRILRCTVERLDAQMLLDPLEKQLYLPAQSVELADADRWQTEMIGQEHQAFARVGIAITDPAPGLRIALLPIEHREHHALIADQTRALIYLSGGKALEAQVRSRSRHEEGTHCIQAVESLEIEEAAVHDIEGPGFGNEQVQDVHLVKSAIADMQERGDVAAQIEQRMKLHRRFGLAKRRPRKQRQAQVDSGGVQSVDDLLQFDPQRLLRIQASRDSDQVLCEIGIDAPVALRIRVGQRVAGNLAADAHVIELARLGTQAR